MSFKVGDKVVLLTDVPVFKAVAGDICEVVEDKNMPHHVGIRYPKQREFNSAPYQNPSWFVHIDVYNSPLFQALKED